MGSAARLESRGGEASEKTCGETECPTLSLVCWQIVKLGAESCFCSGVTLTPSDELWPTLEVQMGLLVPWAHHEMVQRAVEQIRTIYMGALEVPGALGLATGGDCRRQCGDPATLGSPQLTGDGVLGKDCSICAHPSCQTAKALVTVVTHFRLRHLSLTPLQMPTSLAFFFGRTGCSFSNAYFYPPVTSLCNECSLSFPVFVCFYRKQPLFRAGSY